MFLSGLRFPLKQVPSFVLTAIGESSVGPIIVCSGASIKLCGLPNNRSTVAYFGAAE